MQQKTGEAHKRGKSFKRRGKADKRAHGCHYDPSQTLFCRQKPGVLEPPVAGLVRCADHARIVGTCQRAAHFLSGACADFHIDRLFPDAVNRSDEHTYELQSLMRRSYAVLCLKQKNNTLMTYTKYSFIK